MELELHRLELRFAATRIVDASAVQRLANSIQECGQLVECVAAGDPEDARLVLIDGYRRVAALALGAPGLQMLQRPADGLEWARFELHRHAIRVGLCARGLAPAGVDPERALAAGLLHNLGLHVIAAYAPQEFRYLLEAQERGEQFWEAEDWIFGFSHADLGALLAERWSYPLDLVVAIRDHDAPAPQTALGALVQVCDVLVRKLGVGIEPERELSREVRLPTPDLATAEARVTDLVAAQDRFDAANSI
jgi:HD superfamily phosphohydrolase YqeK